MNEFQLHFYVEVHQSRYFTLIQYSRVINKTLYYFKIWLYDHVNHYYSKESILLGCGGTLRGDWCCTFVRAPHWLQLLMLVELGVPSGQNPILSHDNEIDGWERVNISFTHVPNHIRVLQATHPIVDLSMSHSWDLGHRKSQQWTPDLSSVHTNTSHIWCIKIIFPIMILT
jgi:hypothetical protein